MHFHSHRHPIIASLVPITLWIIHSLICGTVWIISCTSVIWMWLSVSFKNEEKDSELKKLFRTCYIEVRPDFENGAIPLLEFCSPMEQQTKERQLQLLDWVSTHEQKLIAYLQTALTMLSGIVIKYTGQSKLSLGLIIEHKSKHCAPFWRCDTVSWGTLLSNFSEVW